MVTMQAIKKNSSTEHPGCRRLTSLQRAACTSSSGISMHQNVSEENIWGWKVLNESTHLSYRFEFLKQVTS